MLDLLRLVLCRRVALAVGLVSELLLASIAPCPTPVLVRAIDHHVLWVIAGGQPRERKT